MKQSMKLDKSSATINKSRQTSVANMDQAVLSLPKTPKRQYGRGNQIKPKVENTKDNANKGVTFHLCSEH